MAPKILSQKSTTLLFVCFLVYLPSVFADDDGDEDFYFFTVMDIHDEIVSLEKYRGKVSLVTNVASYCSYTDDHYKSFQLLQELFSDTKLFNVLAFPCNQFGNQEPESNAHIYEFAAEKYQVTFPMFAKVDVKGPNALDAWRHLAEKSGNVPDWNFWKYLVNHKGQVIGSWGPTKDPNTLYNTIDKAIKRAKADMPSTEKKKQKKIDDEM